MGRMRCPKLLEIAWKDSPPYIYSSDHGNFSGVFPRFVKDLVSGCCSNLTSIHFLPGHKDVESLTTVIRNETADIVFPILGKEGSTTLFGNPFYSLVESPGMLYFSAIKPSASEAIYKSISDAWPVLLFVLLYSVVVGAGFWLLELLGDSKREQKKTATFKFDTFEKLIEGFWWAVVSMTTVGYGDFCPKTIFGRILAIFWILIGLVTVSTFTATVTSVLTAACLSNDFSLTDVDVAVLKGGASQEYAVKQSADIQEVLSVDDIANALAKRKVTGALIDTYIAGHHQTQLENFRLTEIIEISIFYGYVTCRRGKWLRECFSRYMESNRNVIFKHIMSNVQAIKSSSTFDQVREKSSSIFDPQSWEFQLTLYLMLGSLVLLIILGSMIDRCRRKRRKHRGDTRSMFKRENVSEAELLRRHQAESRSLLNELRYAIEDIEESFGRRLAGMVR